MSALDPVSGGGSARQGTRGPVDIRQKNIGHVPAEILLDHDPQYGAFDQIGRKGIGGNDPASLPDLFRKIRCGKSRPSD